MGHLILIAEDIIKFLSRCPPDLLHLLEPHYLASEWQAFVDGPYREAKERDNTNMGGGKPNDGGVSLDDVMGGHTGSSIEVESDSDEDDEDTTSGSGLGGGSAAGRGFGGNAIPEQVSGSIETSHLPCALYVCSSCGCVGVTFRE